MQEILNWIFDKIDKFMNTSPAMQFEAKMIRIFSSYLDEMSTNQVLFLQVKGFRVSNLAKS
jgi:hypothetical protein